MDTTARSADSMSLLLVGSVSVSNLHQLLVVALVDRCVVEHLDDDLANLTTLEAAMSISKSSQ